MGKSTVIPNRSECVCFTTLAVYAVPEHGFRIKIRTYRLILKECWNAPISTHRRWLGLPPHLESSGDPS